MGTNFIVSRKKQKLADLRIVAIIFSLHIDHLAKLQADCNIQLGKVLAVKRYICEIREIEPQGKHKYGTSSKDLEFHLLGYFPPSELYKASPKQDFYCFNHRQTHSFKNELICYKGIEKQRILPQGKMYLHWHSELQHYHIQQDTSAKENLNTIKCCIYSNLILLWNAFTSIKHTFRLLFAYNDS